MFQYDGAEAKINAKHFDVMLQNLYGIVSAMPAKSI